MTQHDDPGQDAPQTDASTTHAPKTRDEVSNVDLQFMGHEDEAALAQAQLEAQSRAPGEYRQRGMDKQDVASAQSMDASDPPSSNMGDDHNT